MITVQYMSCLLDVYLWVNTLIAHDLSGFTCTSSPTMSEKFQYGMRLQSAEGPQKVLWDAGFGFSLPRYLGFELKTGGKQEFQLQVEVGFRGFMGLGSTICREKSKIWF